MYVMDGTPATGLDTLPSKESSVMGLKLAKNKKAVSSQIRDTDTRFKRLAQQWKDDTKYSSSISRNSMHPAYQQIIGMGEPVVPVLLRELEQRPDHWFCALRTITGRDPVPPQPPGHI